MARRRNVRQTAYRILVSRSRDAVEEGHGDLWDSGRLESHGCVGVEYGGGVLESRQRCWWTVQVWDDAGTPSRPSAPAYWEMGLLDAADWRAAWLSVEDSATKADREAGYRWIWGSPGRHEEWRRFRATFRLPRIARSGRIFAVANDWMWTSDVVGIWIDGKAVQSHPSMRASHDWLVPSSNLSAKWFDLDALDAGEHLIAVEVRAKALPGHMTHGLAVFARFELSSGAFVRFGTGPEWRTSLEGGEGWWAPWFDDSAWELVQVVPMDDFQPWPAAPAMLLRKSFTVDQPVSQARLYATALGAYEARLNGGRVSDAMLAPEISQYAKRVLYQSYDVTSQLRVGRNVLGLIAGDGWYASWEGLYAWAPPPRRIIAQLELVLADSSMQLITTGSGWLTAESAIRAAEIRVGEVYDARLEQPGWDTAEFDETAWHAADIADPPPCRLVAQASPPIRATGRLAPRAITQPRPGVYVFDFGQHVAGWCRLRVRGKRGTRIELAFAEILSDEGDVAQSYSINMGEYKRDVFILAGLDALETFEPHFTYRGFRYMQVTGLETPLRRDSVEAVVAHTDLDLTATFRSDSSLLERIWHSGVQTARGNFVAIPTDCPSREQRGWMADAAIFWDAASLMMDLSAFTARQMENVLDDLPADGTFSVAAPEPRNGNSVIFGKWGPAYSDGSVILPWTTWQRYGDLAIIERCWEAMTRHVRFVAMHNQDGIWRNERRFDNGDWLGLDSRDQRPFSLAPSPETPRDLVATAYWAYSTHLLAEMADATGRGDEAASLRATFEAIAKAFADGFLKADGTVGSGSQTSYVLPLAIGLLPHPAKQVAAERLAADIRDRGVALTTGIFGTRFILDVLADAGFPDLAYGLLLRTDYPSWGYMIRNGASTIWESWSGKGYHNGYAYDYSRNHYALGSVCGFLLRRVAGIDGVSPGFETIVIRPLLDARVSHAGADYDSILGRVSTDWARLPDGRFRLDATIPPNARARVHVPALRDDLILESGRDVEECDDLVVATRSADEAVILVGSGMYRFLCTSKNPSPTSTAQDGL